MTTRDLLKLAAYCLAVVAAIAVGGCMSAWNCERDGAGYVCHRVVYEPA